MPVCRAASRPKKNHKASGIGSRHTAVSVMPSVETVPASRPSEDNTIPPGAASWRLIWAPRSWSVSGSNSGRNRFGKRPRKMHVPASSPIAASMVRSEEHTSELQSQSNLVCRLLLEKKNRARTVSMLVFIHVVSAAIREKRVRLTVSLEYLFWRLVFGSCLFRALREWLLRFLILSDP